MRKPLLLLAAVLIGTAAYFFYTPLVKSDQQKKEARSATDEHHYGYDNPLERGLLEFDKTRDPRINRVPTERLLDALYYTENLKVAASGARTAETFVWQERGPIFDSVGPSNGNGRGAPGGTQQPESFTSGRIRAVLIDRSDPTGNTVWSGSVSGGLWKCTNFTTPAPNWQNVNDFFDNLAISSIVQDPSNADIMYFSTGEASSNADAVFGKGVWKTTNHGVTWTQLPSSSVFTRNFKITCDNNGNIYLATRGFGLQRSKDGGNSWENITPTGLVGLNITFCTDVEFTSTGRLHASFGYTTSSAGSTERVQVRYTTAPATVSSGAGWQTPVGLPTDANRIELAARGDTLYAAPTNRANNVVSTYKTFDGGENWMRNNPVDYPAPAINISNTQGWYNLALQISPVSPLEFLVGGLDAYRSVDGGATVVRNTSWVQTPPYVHADHHTYLWEIIGGTPRVIMATDGGLFLSLNDGLTYGDRNTNFAIKQFYSGAIHPTRPHYLLAGAQDNGSHQIKLPGKTYSIEVTGGDGAFVDIDQVNPNFQFTSFIFNQYRRSTNDGNTFSSVNFSSTRGYFINPFDYDDNLKKFYASFADRASPNQSILRWNNPTTGNSSDTFLVSNFTHAGQPSNASALLVSPNVADRLFVGGHNGGLIRIDGASTVNTANAAERTTDLTGASFPFGFINCVAVGSTDNKLLAIFSNYGVTNVWYSGNGGSSWVGIDGNLPDMPVRWALFNPLDDNKIIIATEAGVYTTDMQNGTSTIWMPSAGFPLVRTDMLKLRRSDNLVLAATHGRGLWTTNVPVNVPLPVRNLLLKGSTQPNGQAVLNWSAQGSSNNTRFHLQYSTDGSNFSRIADVASNITSYNHQMPASIGYYRLLANEANTASVVSNTILLKTEMKGKGLSLLVAPNPARSNLSMVISGVEAGGYNWELADASGKILQRGSGAAQQFSNVTLPIAVGNLPSGIYWMRVVQRNKSTTKSFVKE